MLCCTMSVKEVNTFFCAADRGFTAAAVRLGRRGRAAATAVGRCRSSAAPPGRCNCRLLRGDTATAVLLLAANARGIVTERGVCKPWCRERVVQQQLPPAALQTRQQRCRGF